MQEQWGVRGRGTRFIYHRPTEENKLGIRTETVPSQKFERVALTIKSIDI